MDIRKTGGRVELDQLWAAHNSLMMYSTLSVQSLLGAIGNGTTAGRLRTNASVNFRIGRGLYTKASTDDLWNLTAPANLAAAQYQAHWLLLDAAGAASIGSGSVQATAALALANLPALDGTKSVIGVFVAGPSTDYDIALAAQGTIHNGIPSGVPCGVPRHTYTDPSIIDLVSA
jgi:hypothetical protein